MTYVYVLVRNWYLVLGAGCVIAAGAALITGPGLRGSLLLLGGGVWCLLVARAVRGKARAAERHRSLRKSRLERERNGMAPPRD